MAYQVQAGERILQIRSPDLDNCSIAFTGCDQVVADLTAILRGWDIREARASPEAAVIRLKRTASGYLRVSPWSKTPSKCRESFRVHDSDALFGVHYDLLRWYVAAQRSRPCLHSAAVLFASGLVVFPSTTKAGKTTLTIQLAMEGHQVFCDDWLSIQPPGSLGMALGILPWLRLPAPLEVREDFKRFLKLRRGPGNRCWMYVDLREHELSPHGGTAPVAGLVLLDRQAGAEAHLTRVGKDKMLTELIQQNYARQVPSANTFDLLHALTRSADCFSLRYESVRKAAALLQNVFGGPARADPARAEIAAAAMSSGTETYWRANAVSTRQVGETTYLVDARHNAIHQLNPLGTAIWEQLAAPRSVGDLARAVHLAFSDTDYSVIEQDIRALLNGLLGAELIARS
jgi:Coenzyme PQQ synthesis protein D (PqqD)